MSGKVCIITTVHPVFDIRIFQKEAKALVRVGYDVTVIAQHEKSEIVDDIMIIALPKPKNRFSRIFLLTFRVLTIAVHQNAEIYHFHDPELLPIGLLLKLFTRSKVIYDVHEDVPKQILVKYWIPTWFRRPIAAIFNIFEKMMAKAMDAIVTATESIANNFRSNNVIVVNNYPELALFPAIKSLSYKENEKIIIYVGDITCDRGALEMVKALEYLDTLRIRLDLVGKYVPAELEKKIKLMRGYRRVKYRDWLPLNKVYDHLKEASVGIVCLHPIPHQDTLPIKLFEYMAAGLPVIASNYPLWREIVHGNNCGICVDPINPKDIASAIEYLITHPQEARLMGINGRRAVETKYNWEKEKDVLLALYKSLAYENKRDLR